jgi:hypothetical protein
MFTRGPAIGTAPFESFRKFLKVLPRAERARSECGGGSTFPNMYLRGPPASQR